MTKIFEVMRYEWEVKDQFPLCVDVCVQRYHYVQVCVVRKYDEKCHVVEKNL
jgi:hypothetical protein